MSFIKLQNKGISKKLIQYLSTMQRFYKYLFLLGFLMFVFDLPLIVLNNAYYSLDMFEFLEHRIYAVVKNFFSK